MADAVSQISVNLTDLLLYLGQFLAFPQGSASQKFKRATYEFVQSAAA